jgi:hypothetical protein
MCALSAEVCIRFTSHDLTCLCGTITVEFCSIDEKREFLARPEVSQEHVDEVPSETARLMDPSSSMSMNLDEGHPWANWPLISSKPSLFIFPCFS